MSFTDRAREEFARSPVTLAATVGGVLISALALLVAWLQYAGQPQGAPTPQLRGAEVRLHVSNLLMVVAFFFGATFSFASIVRLLARLHGFAAVVLSIPAAVLASFCTMVMLRLLPPRQLDGHALTVAEDMAFYGTAFIFIALNGRPVLETIASSGAEAKSDMTIGGVLFGAGIILLVWGKFVSAGLTKLVQIFLL